MGQAWTVGSQPITVLDLQRPGVPNHFVWHERTFAVRDLLSDWIAEGDWWLEDAGERVHYLLVRTDRAVLTLARQLDTPEAWSVIRMAD